MEPAWAILDSLGWFGTPYSVWEPLGLYETPCAGMKPLGIVRNLFTGVKSYETPWDCTGRKTAWDNIELHGLVWNSLGWYEIPSAGMELLY